MLIDSGTVYALIGVWPPCSNAAAAVITLAVLPGSNTLETGMSVVAARLAGDSISARQALEWGLINRVAPSAELGQATAELIDRVLECAPAAVRLQKELIIRWRNTNLRSAVEFGIDAFAQAYATEEPREAMQAFLDKRTPRFRS